MTNEGTIFLLGILIALSPFLGLPYAWLMVIIPVLGILAAAFALLARVRRLADAHAPASPDETRTTA
jgi:hypothetical protein